MSERAQALATISLNWCVFVSLWSHVRRTQTHSRLCCLLFLLSISFPRKNKHNLFTTRANCWYSRWHCSYARILLAVGTRALTHARAHLTGCTHVGTRAGQWAWLGPRAGRCGPPYRRRSRVRPCCADRDRRASPPGSAPCWERTRSRARCTCICNHNQQEHLAVWSRAESGINERS